MKKSLLICASALMLCGSLQARSWDFSAWSAETLANLEADEKWSINEKGEDFAGCYWYKATSVEQGCDADGFLVANGVTIAETKGLKVKALGENGVALATDYQYTKDKSAWGPYHGAQYLWFYGTFTLTVPNVAPGTKVKVGMESHKPGEKRGVEMYIGDDKIAWSSEQTALPDAYDVYEWVVPDTYEENVDITFKQTKGCHVYSIVVEEGDTPVESYNVAYVYDSSYNLENGYGANGGLENDPIYNQLESNFTVTVLDVNADDIKALTSDQFNDSLITFDAVVLCEAVGSGNTYAKGMVNIINKVPMVNFKAFMYKNWSVGAGANPKAKATAIKVNEDYADSKLFEGIEISDNGEIELFNTAEVTFGNLAQGYTAKAGGLFDGDEVLATVANGDGVANAIHVHSKRNQYILLPLSSDNLNWDNVSENATLLAENAVKMVAATKAKVLPATKPTIQTQNKDGVTVVTISCSTSGSKIYYTTDGTDPTEASAVYTEAFEVTVDQTVVKAFATAQGYEPSEIASQTINVMTQTAAPQIAVNGNIVTISGEGALFYNYTGDSVSSRSAAYTEPVTVPENTNIYAFAVASGKLQSAVVSAPVTVIDLKQDTLSHFTANETDWFTNAVIYDYAGVAQPTPESNWAAKAAYYFGKNGWTGNMVDQEVVVKDEQGNPIKSLVNPDQDSVVVTYKPNPEAVKTVRSTSDTDWYLYSRGQSITGETNLAPENGVGNGADSRYAETAEDLIGTPTKGCITFGGKANGETWTAAVMSVNKFQAPFDVVTYLGNGNGSGTPVVVAEVSADGENWTKIGTLQASATKRYFKKSRVNYSGTDEVFVRVAHVAGSNKGQLYDIIILSGNAPVISGIENISDNKVVKNDAVFDMMGRQVAKMVPGQIYIKNNKKVIVR